MRRDFAFVLQKRRLKSKTNDIIKLIQKKPLHTAAVLAVVFLLLPFLFIAAVVKDLPTPDNIARNAEYSTSILDRNGKVVYQVFEDKNIVPVELKDLPEHVGQATIAVEDKDFFKHKGFSLFGIFRAAVKNTLFGRREGGSTLTQQLVKNNLLSPEKTITRKFKELILAIELERRYSKEQILEMYLNMTPYGGTAYGIQSAAQHYFGKDAKDLTLIEAAVLAGFPQSPSLYSPYIGEKGAYINRTEQVLRRMREDKHIDREKEKELVEKLPKVKFKKNVTSFPAAHFVFYVKSLLDEMIDNDALFKKGLVIKTTLDLDLQKEAEKIIRQEIEDSKGLNITNGAAVVMDPKTGDILAMVGSIDFNNEEFGKYNAALGLRQPGSTLKPFTYALALENGFTPSSVIMDVPTDFTSGGEGGESYTPVNYDGKYRGPVQLRMALGNSLNVPAVKVLARVGLKPFMQKAFDAGLVTLEPTTNNMRKFGLSLTLGGGEVRLLDLVTAYGVLANEGKTTPSAAIMEVRDYKNKLLYRHKKEPNRRIFSRESVFLVSHILSDNNARLISFGTNSYLNIPGKTVAVKTGTTDDKKDNWTVGYTRDLVVGVWVGNNDGRQMNQALASGISGAAPIWRRIFLKAFEQGYKDGLMALPDKVRALEIDAFFGGTPYDGIPKRSEYFIEGTEPKEASPFYKKIKISKSTGKKANALEIASGNYEEKEFFVVVEEDPLSTDGKNRWQEAINKWASEQGDEKWKPPGEVSDTNSDDISIQVMEPSDKQKIDANDIRLFAKAISERSLRSFQVFINDALKENTGDAVIDRTIHLDDGIYTVKFVAVNEKDKRSEVVLRIGVRREVGQENAIPTATSTPSPTPVITLSL